MINCYIRIFSLFFMFHIGSQHCCRSHDTLLNKNQLEKSQKLLIFRLDLKIVEGEEAKEIGYKL